MQKVLIVIKQNERQLKEDIETLDTCRVHPVKMNEPCKMQRTGQRSFNAASLLCA
jgi:hypothetical protein